VLHRTECTGTDFLLSRLLVNVSEIFLNTDAERIHKEVSELGEVFSDGFHSLESFGRQTEGFFLFFRFSLPALFLIRGAHAIAHTGIKAVQSSYYGFLSKNTGEDANGSRPVLIANTHRLEGRNNGLADLRQNGLIGVFVAEEFRKAKTATMMTIS